MYDLKEREKAKDTPWKPLPGERTAFGDEVRRIVGEPNRSTRAIPYLVAFLGLYLALSVWSQSYASRHGTRDVIERIDRLEASIQGLKATLKADGVRIEDNRRAGVATDAAVEANRRAVDDRAGAEKGAGAGKGATP